MAGGNRILTQEEYRAVKKKTIPVSKPIIPESTEIKEIKPIVNYFLLHPDGSLNRQYTGNFYVTYNDKEYTVKIEQGIAKTSMIGIKNKLQEFGFIFMYEKNEEV